jgi:predicted membrane-bound spermidine synthase
VGSGGEKQLLVNGIGITMLTSITKIMAHAPLTFLPHKPESSLVICFGMGTTFRSLASWDIGAWAVELVPSVRDAFGFYFDDAKTVMQKPGAHVVIDDGRRFLRRTREQFDVITLDPPPPVEAAGSSLLYSTGFYEDAKARLKPHGILAQWFPGGEGKILQGVAAAISQSFPHVRVFRSVDGWGYHFLASREKLPDVNPETLVARMPKTASIDLMEWYPGKTPQSVMSDFLKQEIPLSEVLGDPNWMITDDRPLNEYYLLRRLFAKM